MTSYSKAKLQPVRDDENETPEGEPIEVQFNPNSLRLSRSASNDVGATDGRQRPQYLGTSSATLTVELVFDTADEGTTDAPRSVLEKTSPIEQLLLPSGDKQSPAKVRFEWGPFTLTGIIESMSLDLEFFSEDGVPLRAKMNLSMREQRADLEFGRAGPGANSPGNAVSPLAGGLGAVGGIGLGASLGASFGLGGSVGVGVGLGAGIGIGAGAGVRTALALEGESAAAFAARVGVDPSAWRAIAAGQASSPLSLPAGAAIDFSTGISSGSGLGARGGVHADTAPSLDAAFGLAKPAPGQPLANLSAPGFALAEAGGVRAAVNRVAAIQSERESSATRRAFAGAARGAAGRSEEDRAGDRPSPPDQQRKPLRVTGFPGATMRSRAAPAPTLPRPDARATTFGRAVPLRPQVEVVVDERSPVAPSGGRASKHRCSPKCGCGGHRA
jgi:hypothetical protein